MVEGELDLVSDPDPASGPGLRDERCPRCGVPGPLRIYYGYPAPDQIRAALRGEIALGGQVYDHDQPRFECRMDTCGETWS